MDIEKRKIEETKKRDGNKARFAAKRNRNTTRDQSLLQLRGQGEEKEIPSTNHHDCKAVLISHSHGRSRM